MPVTSSSREQLTDPRLSRDEGALSHEVNADNLGEVALALSLLQRTALRKTHGKSNE